MKDIHTDEEQLIVDFIHGRLTGKEVILINKKIREDKDFAERLAFASALKIGTQKERVVRNELKEKLLEKIKRRRRRKLFKIGIIALLSIALIATLLYFFSTNHQLPETEKNVLKIALKAQIKQEYDINIASADTQKELLGPELIYYNKVEEGLTSMNVFLENSSENIEPIAFYYGASLILYKDEYAKAIPNLERATSINSDYRQDAHFYLVIAYALNGQSKKANNVLATQSLSLEDFPESIQKLLR